MKQKILLVFLTLFGIVAFGGAHQAAGVSTENQPDEDLTYSGHGYLLISPNQFRYGILEPGSNYTETFMAYNVGDQPISFNLSAEPFWVKDGTYEATYSEATNRTKISTWITFPGGTKYTLAPRDQDGDRAEFTVRIKVPSDAIGGGQYAAVMANIESADPGPGSFHAQSRIALFLYSTIDGDIIYSGKIINRGISGFSFNSIVKTSSTIENTGNADFEAHYRLLVEPFFGNKVAYDNTETKIILPETKRIFEQNWDGAPTLGIFNATQEITYVNENGEQVTDSFKHVVIICPLWLILIVIAIITSIVVANIAQRKKRKINHKKPSWDQE